MAFSGTLLFEADRGRLKSFDPPQGHTQEVREPFKAFGGGHEIARDRFDKPLPARRLHAARPGT